MPQITTNFESQPITPRLFLNALAQGASTWVQASVDYEQRQLQHDDVTSGIEYRKKMGEKLDSEKAQQEVETDLFKATSADQESIIESNAKRAQIDARIELVTEEMTGYARDVAKIGAMNEEVQQSTGLENLRSRTAKNKAEVDILLKNAQTNEQRTKLEYFRAMYDIIPFLTDASDPKFKEVIAAVFNDEVSFDEVGQLLSSLDVKDPQIAKTLAQALPPLIRANERRMLMLYWAKKDFDEEWGVKWLKVHGAFGGLKYKELWGERRDSINSDFGLVSGELRGLLQRANLTTPQGVTLPGTDRGY